MIHVLCPSFSPPRSPRPSVPRLGSDLDGKAAFQKLKGLAGTWTGPIGSATGPKGRISYEVIRAAAW